LTLFNFIFVCFIYLFFVAIVPCDIHLLHILSFIEHLFLFSPPQGDLSCYRNRQDFRTDPLVLYKDKRPIDLDEYIVVTSGGMHNTINGGAAGGGVNNDTNSVTTSNTTKNLPAFQITLKPKWDVSNRQWNLRCDTEEILNNWLIVMRQVSPQSFAGGGGGGTQNVYNGSVDNV
jgi:hypothetical protein